MSHRIHASEWLNTSAPLQLDELRGRVVMVTAFQMLCQGCARFSIPQATSIHGAFPREDLVVIGLHCVFEHHHVMTPEALRVFAHEYRLPFPIAVDEASDEASLPRTMREWQLAGTPTLLLFDRAGNLALRHFGHITDLQLGVALGGLIESSRQEPPALIATSQGVASQVCRLR